MRHDSLTNEEFESTGIDQVEESLTTLMVTEIYASIQGESTHAGRPCTFIRLTGCPMRCRWCDTAYGFEGGQAVSLPEVLEKVDDLGIGLVELTGGEPLAQESAFELVDALAAKNYEVLVETGGGVCIQKTNPSAKIIMDLKCPGSGMSEQNLWQNLDYLKETDEIKFVISDRADFAWALEVIDQRRLESFPTLLFSAAFGLLEPQKLADWLVEANLPNSRLNLQQHKYIWSPRRRGV